MRPSRERRAAAAGREQAPVEMQDRSPDPRAGPRRCGRRRPAARAARATPGQPWPGPRVQGIGARQPSRPPGSTTRSGRDHRVLETELLAHVEEGRAAQREQQHRRGARARLAAVAGAVALLVVVREHPGGPGVDRIEHCEVARCTRARRGLPGREERREVEAQVQLVSAPVVGRDPLGVEQEDLAHHRAITRVAVEQRRRSAQVLVGDGIVVERAVRDRRELRVRRRRAPDPCRCCGSRRRGTRPRRGRARSAACRAWPHARPGSPS